MAHNSDYSHIYTTSAQGLSLYEIMRCLGANTQDLGTLASSSLVNKWSLHKPVMLISGYDTPADITPNWATYMKTKVRETNSNTLCPYGLKLGSSHNIYEVIGETSAPAVDWVHQRPATTGTHFRRTLDFDGYTSRPNYPMNPVSTFNYYLDGTPNELVIDTNDGEASDTSIQIRELTQLDSYKLMVAVKEGSFWQLAVMNTVISQSMEEGIYFISFILPTGHNFTKGIHDAYIVGVDANAGVYTNEWIQQTDSVMHNFTAAMIPLPLENKAASKFSFNVIENAPTNIVYLSYTLYLKRADYTLAAIEFYAEKQGQAPSGLLLSVTDIVVEDDYKTQEWEIREAFQINSWTYNSVTHKIEGSVSRNLIDLGYDIKAGDHPELKAFNPAVNIGGYTAQYAGYFDVVLID